MKFTTLHSLCCVRVPSHVFNTQHQSAHTLTKFALQWSKNVTAEVTQVAVNKKKLKRKEHLKRKTTSDGNQISVKTEAMAKIVYHFGQLILCHRHFFVCVCAFTTVNAD